MNEWAMWGLKLHRLFGIQVRVHWSFFLITIPMFLRLDYLADGFPSTFDIFMLTVGMLFFIVLLHEYGHCFAARWVGGSSNDILIWPLGGLAFVDVPHNPRAHFITTICGPAVNFVLCLGCVILFLAAGFSPLKALNPFEIPYTTDTYNYRDGRTYSSSYRHYYYWPDTAELVGVGYEVKGKNLATVSGVPIDQMERAQLPTWLMWVWRFCWLNWWLFLFNMLVPAYPMDCGRLIHAYLWSRSDHRSATITCCYIGYVTAAIMLGISILTNRSELIGLAIFIALNCYMAMNNEVESERGAFGYDFSQGYTSLERDDPPPPQPKRPGPIKRWLDGRKARKIKAEQEAVARDDERMDQLLDKIAKSGKNSLTDEERRFMERVSARYRNK